MDAADIQKRMRAHFVAFGAILVLALVAAGSVLAGVSNIYLIIGIAAVQAVIILTSLMHARAEGPWVRGVLLFAALSVAGFIVVTVLGQRSMIDGTQHTESAVAAEPATEEAH